MGCSHAGSNIDSTASGGRSAASGAANAGAPSTGGNSALGGGSALGGSAGSNATLGGNTALAGSAGTFSGGAANAGGAASSGAPSGGAASGGAGGASATAGNAGSVSSAGTSSAGSHYPFPQNNRSSRCTYPSSAAASDAERAYAAWKSEIVTSNGAGGHLRTQRPNSPGAETNSTVSEGIAYGMLIAVEMGDQNLFDELWKYSQLWLDSNGLMNWYINAAGNQVLGSGGATDADEDIAWALVMASRQWGGAGSLGSNYLDLAKTQIQHVFDAEVDHANGQVLMPGDTWGGALIFNPSYFAPNEYRVFATVSGNAAWTSVVDSGYTIVQKSLNGASGNASNGLVPAWCDYNGAPKTPPSGAATNYQYDSARTPFRIGLDYCFNGEARAKTYLDLVSGFFSNVGASKIVDGYDLNGAPHPDPDTPAGSPQSAVFVGGAAVGAMHDAKYQSFINDAYALVATGTLLARSRYYNLSWTALDLLMLTGNFVEYSN